MLPALAIMFGLLCPQADSGKRPPPTDKTSAKQPLEWRFKLEAGVDFEYDSNVFLLSDTKQDRLESRLPADVTSGRYDDMNSADDMIAKLSIAYGAEGPSPLGRKIRLLMELEFDAYFENEQRSFFEGALRASQDIGSNGRLEFAFSLVPVYFKKNYLVGATDTTGTVSSAERIYNAASYMKWELEFKYRHELVKATSSQPWRVEGVFTVEYENKSYGESRFETRDAESVSFGPGIQVEYQSRWKAKLGYVLESSTSPIELEAMLLNEPEFGVPLNADADATDNNAFTLQRADHSYMGHRIELFGQAGVSERVRIEVSYVLQFRDYQSEERFDISHRDRSDTGHEFAIGVKVRITPQWEAGFGYRYYTSSSHHRADPDSTGETLDYVRHVVFGAVTFTY